ncbi:MAG: type II toxin-antitoxin system VapC family toxin [Rudaea sp.]
MKRYVLDTRAATMWFLHLRKSNVDRLAAKDLYDRARHGRIQLIEPPIWQTDVAATVTRLQPTQALKLISALTRIDAKIDDEYDVLRRAAKLAIELEHRLFDTIYHAVALKHSITLITANAGYYRKARHLGNIMLLRDWPIRKQVHEHAAKHVIRKLTRPSRLHKKHRIRARDCVIVGA